MVGGASSAFISQRLRTAQPRTLREHGIDPSSIPVGRVVAMGRHHGIFLKNLCSTNRKFLAVAGRADGFRGYPAVGTTLAITPNDGKGWIADIRRCSVRANRLTPTGSWDRVLDIRISPLEQ